MVQVKQMTREEKIQMYMKLNKRELAEMLVNANDVIHDQPKIFIIDRAKKEQIGDLAFYPYIDQTDQPTKKYRYEQAIWPNSVQII